MRIRMVKRATVAASLMVATMAGCSDSSEEKLHLLNDNKVDDSEQVRLRALQTMKVVSIDNTSEEQTEIGVPVGSWDEFVNSQIPAAIQAECGASKSAARRGFVQVTAERLEVQNSELHLTVGSAHVIVRFWRDCRPRALRRQHLLLSKRNAVEESFCWCLSVAPMSCGRRQLVARDWGLVSSGRRRP